jgi:hypothetical protein
VSKLSGGGDVGGGIAAGGLATGGLAAGEIEGPAEVTGGSEP